MTGNMQQNLAIHTCVCVYIYIYIDLEIENKAAYGLPILYCIRQDLYLNLTT